MVRKGLPQVRLLNSMLMFLMLIHFAFCIGYDGRSFMFGKELYKFLHLDGDYFYPSRSKFDSQNVKQKPKSSKIQSLNKSPELSEFLAIGSVYDPPTSFGDRKNFFVYFLQAQASTGMIQTKYELRLQTRKKLLPFPSISFHFE